MSNVLHRTLISTLFLSFASISLAQEKVEYWGVTPRYGMGEFEEEDTLYYKADIMPEFPEMAFAIKAPGSRCIYYSDSIRLKGEPALQRFIAENQKYPDIARSVKAEGTVKTRFVVEPDGKLTYKVICESVDPMLAKEAIRVLRLMPRWEPGQVKGKPVRVVRELSFHFKYQP